MMNERITEAVVRHHFAQFLDKIEIEEQRSNNAKIDKLLKSSSKKGSGRGYPDFLITYKTNSNFLIVVECKASIVKHESKTKDDYADYAVDGALLYSSYLSKDFDVLAIAVSGENTRNLKISHFLHLKGEKNATDVFGDELLSTEVLFKWIFKKP